MTTHCRDWVKMNQFEKFDVHRVTNSNQELMAYCYRLNRIDYSVFDSPTDIHQGLVVIFHCWITGSMPNQKHLSSINLLGNEVKQAGSRFG